MKFGNEGRKRGGMEGIVCSEVRPKVTDGCTYVPVL